MNMRDADFDMNVQRLIASCAYSTFLLHASREMYGKSYFALGTVEKATLDQMANGMVWNNLAQLTPQVFANLQPAGPTSPAGFAGPMPPAQNPQKS